VLIGGLGLIALIITVSAAVTIFVQQFPSVPVNNPVVIPHCTSVTPNTMTGSIVVKGVGEDKSYVLFNCSSAQAFDIASQSSPIPVFTLGQGYKNISAVLHVTNIPQAPTPPCNPSSTGGVPLSNNVAIPMAPNPYDYCVGYDVTTLAPGNGLAAFTLTWEQ